MTNPDDQDLKRAFHALREHDRGAGRVPDFSAMMAEAGREAAARPRLEVVAAGARRRVLWLGGGASAALAAGVAALLLMGRGPSGDDEFARLVSAYATETTAGEWSSPTASLLDVPGMDLMRSLPSIGSPLRGLDRSSLPPRPSSPPEENS